ncbi:MAG: hypothetical protein ACYDAL_16615, partial [Candidatus Dormibacteraceae bacterium]
EPPAFAVPADNRRRLDDGQALLPASGPETRKPHPQNPVTLSQARAGIGPESYLELMTEGRILEDEVSATADDSE